MTSTPILSVLDLVPLTAGGSAQAIKDTVELAHHVEALGYQRYWLAEHHNMQSLVSSAPELLIAALSQRTTTLRLGAGGIMLPNHSPLKVAEMFRTLEALAPGRIDLGLGRAPGTDMRTALALRRSREALQADDFEAQLTELLAFGGREFAGEHPFAGTAFEGVTAAPYDQPLAPLWMLSSSGHGASVAAEIGAGLAFAAHINPDFQLAAQAIRAYRQAFRPSGQFPHPKVIVAQTVIVADTDAEAERLALPLGLMFLQLMRGQTGPFASVEEAERYPYTPAERAQLDTMRQTGRFVAGSPKTVKARLDQVLEMTGADELMIGGMMPDLTDRKRSYDLLAQLYPQKVQQSAAD